MAVMFAAFVAIIAVFTATFVFVSNNCEPVTASVEVADNVASDNPRNVRKPSVPMKLTKAPPVDAPTVNSPIPGAPPVC